MPDGSPFRSWNGVEPSERFPGVRLTAIAGEQVCLCRVTYEAGKMVPSHAHEHTEQVMAIVAGAVTITIGDETRTAVTGDVIVINRGIVHELVSEHGVTFFEALSPVPLDHVPDRERDLVLGPDQGALHVER